MSHNIDHERICFINKQNIHLNKFESDGWILDIGGGGEGIISQLFGEQVIAIDSNKRELEEAPTTESLKIIMNAAELKFLNNAFNTVTSFFTMMYIDNDNKEKVFKEIHRVLKPEGIFFLWDMNIPAYKNCEKDIYALPLEINLENKIIETGYGVPWSGREQSINSYISLGKKIGFKITEKEENGETYFIKFIK